MHLIQNQTYLSTLCTINALGNLFIKALNRSNALDVYLLPEVPTTFFTIALFCLKMKQNKLTYYELVKVLPEFSTSFISEEDFVVAIDVNVNDDVDVGTGIGITIGTSVGVNFGLSLVLVLVMVLRLVLMLMFMLILQSFFLLIIVSISVIVCTSMNIDTSVIVHLQIGLFFVNIGVSAVVGVDEKFATTFDVFRV